MIYKERLIGFFDILGFSAKLKAHDLQTLHSSFQTIIQKALKTTPKSITPEGVQFEDPEFFYIKIISDSIVVVSHPVDTQTVNKFILAVAQLFEEFFLHQFPLRGVITVDDVLIDEENDILLAKKFPEMVKSERKWKWSGCVILEDCQQIILDNVYPPNIIVGNGFKNDPLEEHQQFKIPIVNAGNPCVYYHPPIENGINDRMLLCLNWVYLCSQKALAHALGYLEDEKKENTIKFVNHIYSLPPTEIPLHKQSLPATHAKLMLTRSKVRVLSINKEGAPVDVPEISLAFWEEAPHSTN